MHDPSGITSPSAPSKSSAQPYRWLQLSLFAVGLVGWMTFVLACVGGPAWSPDGSKILYGYRDYKNSRDAVAIYDRATHTSKTIYVKLMPKEDKDEFLLTPSWQADGERALVWVTSDVDSDVACMMLSIPVKSKTPLQSFNFGTKSSCMTANVVPQLGNRIYIAGEDQLYWIDLATGEMERSSIADGPGNIAEHKGQLVYMREVKRPAPTEANKDAKEGGLEVGQVDLEKPEFKARYTLWDADLKGIETGNLQTPSWEPNGERIALAIQDDSDKIAMLDENRGLTGILTPDLGVKHLHFGQLVFSSDRKSLYAPAVASTNGDNGPKDPNTAVCQRITLEKGEEVHGHNDACDYYLAEIPLDGSKGRLTHIAPFSRKDMDNDTLSNSLSFALQMSLSPDGKYLAASTATLPKSALADRDRALFLIDVQHQARHITRIPVPTDSSLPAKGASK